MRKIRTIIAALLVAVFVLGALNVSVAGQRDGLAKRVRALTKRVEVLETQGSGVESCQGQSCQDQLWVMWARTKWLRDSDGAFQGNVYGMVRPQATSGEECNAGDTAVWRDNGYSGGVYLSC